MYRRKSINPNRTLGRKKAEKSVKLGQIYKEIHETILVYQSHTLGLFPRGQSQHARVRDNVYCAMALWSVSLAYRHVGWDEGRTYELEKSAIKCMRGILFCYMRQAHKVEQFKLKQCWTNALHSRFDHMTGDPVMEDDGWGHLQIDGTSLFMLVLSQMTASGLQVILTKDEVDFIQNLVYYIERAYRTPDFGMWERGSIENTGKRELHASSIGMAKAALDAIHGLNLFGDQGSSLSIIHVDPDAQYRNHVILSTLLPRESNSKETDAALLCVTGFPAFSIENTDLKQSTEDRLIDRLECQFGFKRFAKDGHHTIKEDKTKKFYDPLELEAFEGTECQWPLFFAYSYITAVFRGELEHTEGYWKKLTKCLTVSESGYHHCPRLYYHSNHPDEIIESFSSGGLSIPSSPANLLEPLHEENNKPFLWAQSLFLIATLLKNDLLSPSELDPLGLHLPPVSARYIPASQKIQFRPHHRDSMIQVALISSTSRLQAILATYGIPTQTSKQIESVSLGDAGETLVKVYSRLGQNKKLGLSGRPLRPIGAIGTSKIYRIFGRLAAFFPTDLNIADFYMSYDIELYIDTVKSILTFLNTYWNVSGRPTVTLLLRENLFKGGYSTDMINFLAQIKKGEVDGIKLRLDRLQSLIATSCIDNIVYNLEGDETYTVLSTLIRSPRLRSRSSSLSFGRTGSSGSISGDDVFTVETLQLSRFDPTPDKPEEEPDFGPTDIASQSSEELRAALASETNYTAILHILHKLIQIHHIKHLIDHIPIFDRIADIYDEAATKKHWMAVRFGASLLHKVVDCLAPSLSSVLVKEKEVSIGVFHYSEYVITEPMSPVELSDVIYRQCMDHEPIEAVLQQEMLIYLGDLITRSDISPVFDGMLRLRIGWIIQAMKNELSRSKSKKILYQLSPYQVKQLLKATLTNENTRTPLYKRQLNGALNRVPKNFYIKVYTVLTRTTGGITVWGTALHQYPTIHVMSAHEKSFSVEVEKLLSNISSPHYRQLVVELLMVVSTILERNPELNHQSNIDLDNMLKTAFALLDKDINEGRVTIEQYEEDNIEEQKLHPIYYLPESGLNSTSTYMAKAAINELLTDGVHFQALNNTCSVS